LIFHFAQPSHPPIHWQIFSPALPSDCCAIDFPGPAIRPSKGLPRPRVARAQEINQAPSPFRTFRLSRSLHSPRPYNATISTFRPLILRNEKSISTRSLHIGSIMWCASSKCLNTILPRVIMVAVVATIFAGCMTLPPSASLNPPSNRSGPIDANAWVRQVEITDPRDG
jgi:hypothetical protein